MKIKLQVGDRVLVKDADIVCCLNGEKGTVVKAPTRDGGWATVRFHDLKNMEMEINPKILMREDK